MRIATVGMLLRVGGLIIGIAAIVGLAVGADVVHLPPLLVKIAVYKLAFLAAVALLVAGALVGRRAAGASRERLGSRSR